MVQIFESLKTLINPELPKAAAALGEDESKISNAASVILPGILSSLLYNGPALPVESALKEAGRSNILPDLENIFTGNGSGMQEGLGNKLIRAVMGEQAKDFSSSVASRTGISQASSSQLTTMIATAVAGFMGGKMAAGNLSPGALFADLGREKERFSRLVPDDLKGILGIDGKYANQPQKEGKRKYGWLIWLLLIIALILLAIFGWRSCHGKGLEDLMERGSDGMEQAAGKVSAMAEEATDDLLAAAERLGEKIRAEFTLPNGEKIVSYKGGVEEKMIKFLESDAYKNAGTDADLSGYWFEFENIDFERGSATELDEGSMVHINNIAAILKAYPEAKVKIGGNADKSGNRLYNMEISKERAATIKSLLERAGIDGKRIVTEGFGDEHAVWPEGTKAEQSEEDRDIALRFTK